MADVTAYAFCDRLVEELRRVLQPTMQPTSVAVWLKQDAEGGKPGER